MRWGFLKDELSRLQCFLKDADAKTRAGNASATNWVQQIKDAAYEAENIIEVAGFAEERKRIKKGFVGFISRYACFPRDLVTLRKAGIDIRRVRRKIQEIMTSAVTLGTLTIGTNAITEPCRAPTNAVYKLIHDNDVIIGFQDDLNRIGDKLKNMDNKQLTVVSIVATGGVGKTTLARKLYSSAVVTGHFNSFAFTSISQKFDVSHILKDIAQQAMGTKREVEKFNTMGIDEIARKLHDFLKGNRYLIVLDDVWTTDTWDMLKKVFPDAENGSRVLLTTRNFQAAKQADKLTFIHKLRHLNEEESWRLFCQRAFPSYETIDTALRLELENLGKNLAKKCSGLPLALVVLGAHLLKNLQLDMWMKMDSYMDWEITEKWKIMQHIIARSYDDMHHHLKSCFLYMACLPEHNRIADCAVTESWISEELIPQTTRYSLEETAQSYLDELAQRSMVQIINSSSANGLIHAIKVHDILQDWAVRKAQKEGFVIVCKNLGDLRASLSTLTFYRTVLHSVCYDGIDQTQNTRTIYGFKLPSLTFRKLWFLRVLYLSNSNLEHFCNEVRHLVHLRYIAFDGCYNVVLPSSIGRLLNLGSINLIDTDLPFIPASLWDIATLRHARFWPVRKWSPVKAEKQKELQTLSISVINAGKVDKYIWSDTQKSLMHMTQLTSLMLFGDHNIPADILTNLSNHHNLVRLYLGWVAGLNVFLRISLFPLNLRTLVLHIRSPLQEDVLLHLSKLRNLVLLFLEIPEYGGRSLFSPCEMREYGKPSRWALNLPSLSELVLEEMVNMLAKEKCEELEKKGCKLIINDS
ncbi:hypothetical protein HU200_029278 [Digitaria exilis]|uniref:Uncharacterized protein n=1 Tax=Digitaria exilis TaxID=1010633 RepID=A0A835C4Q4_9POAL|nr:hypothetical protein HU200_029278 [Digitaria exilis]